MPPLLMWVVGIFLLITVASWGENQRARRFCLETMKGLVGLTFLLWVLQEMPGAVGGLIWAYIQHQGAEAVQPIKQGWHWAWHFGHARALPPVPGIDPQSYLLTPGLVVTLGMGTVTYLRIAWENVTDKYPSSKV